MPEIPIAVAADHTEGWPTDPATSPAQMFLTLGDLAGQDVDRLIATGRPVYGVYGNHDHRGYLDQPGAMNLAGDRIAGLHRWGQAVVLGVEGCVRYNDDAHDVLWTQDEYAAALDPIDLDIDLIVTHCPPAGCNDHSDPTHHGIEALARLVSRCRPKLILHGHTYPMPPVAEFHGARVLHVDGWTETTLDLL